MSTRIASSLLALTLLLPVPALAQEAGMISEAPSTVQATYVEASATRALQPGEKVESLFNRNAAQPYVLQRLTDRTWWLRSQYYGTIFYVGDDGVLLVDPLDGRAEQIGDAIASVTDLPVTAVLYSHNHADHIGSAAAFTEGENVRVIASSATRDKQAFLDSTHPAPTETVAWPRGSFEFEDLTVELYGFERAAHADDSGIWLLTDEGIAHVPDLVNPDQPPFWAFAGSENYVYYKANVEQLADLDWDYLSGGHGNVGSRVDIEFYRVFLGDLEQAVGEAMANIPWGTGVDPSMNAHTAYLPAWLDAIGVQATEALREKYGDYYGFEAATPPNAAMVATAMLFYR